jgi:hypothetical protein
LTIWLFLALVLYSWTIRANYSFTHIVLFDLNYYLVLFNLALSPTNLSFLSFELLDPSVVSRYYAVFKVLF